MTEAERQAKQAELDRLLKEEELARLEAEEADANPAESLGRKVGNALKSVGQGYTKFMGAQQRGVAHLIASALEKKGKIPQGDTVTQVAKSAGYALPRGPSIADMPGWGSILGNLAPFVKGINAGNMADLAIDTATDPVTYEAPLLSKMASIPKYANWGETKIPGIGKVSPVRTAHAIVSPIESGSNYLSNKGYDLAAGHKLNNWAKMEGHDKSPAQIMREGNFLGGVADQPDFFDAQNQMFGERMSAVKEIAKNRKLIGNVDFDFLPSIEQEAKYFDNIPDEKSANIAAKIRARGQYVNERYPTGAMPFEEGSKAKTESANRANYGKRGAFQSQADAEASRVDKAVANAHRNAEEATLKRNAPDIAPEFSEAKKGFENTADVADKAFQLGNTVPNQRGIFTPTLVDMGLLGAGMTGSPHALGALALKKSYEIARTPGAAAALGYGANKLNKVSKYGLLDSTVRNAARSPWNFSSSKNSEEEQ